MLYVLRNTASTRSISIFCTAETAINAQYFGIQYCCGILLYSQIFQGSVLRVLPSTGSVSSVGTATTRRNKKKNIRTAYSEFEVYFHHQYTRSIIPSPFYSRKRSRMVPRVGAGANYCREGRLGYSEY